MVERFFFHSLFDRTCYKLKAITHIRLFPTRFSLSMAHSLNHPFFVSCYYYSSYYYFFFFGVLSLAHQFRHSQFLDSKSCSHERYCEWIVFWECCGKKRKDRGKNHNITTAQQALHKLIYHNRKTVFLLCNGWIFICGSIFGNH